MKKLLGIIVLGLLWSSNANALPKCKGDDEKKWTNCFGTKIYTGDDKYLGDGILAFFENPSDGVISPQASLKSAILMQKKAKELNQKYIDQKRFSFSIRKCSF